MKLDADSKSHAEMLLSEPGKFLPDNKFDRPSVSARVTALEKFDSRRLPRQYSRQYAHSYSVRLWSMRPKLEEVVATEWPDVPVKKIAELCEFAHSGGAGSGSRNDDDASVKKEAKPSRDSDEHGQHIAFREDITVAVIGTIFKYQPEKPSILQELSEDNPMIPVIVKTKYTSDKDTIQLEDETTRVHLIPSATCGMTVGGIVNGVVCAVKGKPNINGKFEVTDVLFPTPNPAPPLGLPKLDGEMIFVSGLEIGSDEELLTLKADILFDILEGLAGCPSETENYINSRTKVFFVGNTVTKFAVDDKGNVIKNRLEIMQRLDNMLDDLSRTMDVFIMPGENDPSEPTLPQFPLHHCSLPSTSRRETFRAITNPARLGVPMSSDENSPKLDLLLSSGQNVMDALRNSETVCPVEMAQTILKWGHLCPTAPDTLPLHPGVEDDVFVLDTLPNVFVIGNQSKFDGMDWLNTKIFTIPKFSETGMIVVLNQDLEATPLMVYGS